MVSGRPESAASKACHGSMAHLMRGGNFRSPDSATRSPNAPGSSDSGPSSIARTCAYNPRASPSVLPLTFPVIMEADAREMAQP